MASWARLGRGRGARLAGAVLLLGLAGSWSAPARGSDARADLDLTSTAAGRSLFEAGQPIGTRHPVQACVVVATSGAQAGDRVTVTATGVEGSLAADLLLSVEVGTGGSGQPGPDGCTGFSGTEVFHGSLTQLGAGPVPVGWDPAASPSRTFRFTAVAAAGAAQQARAAARIAWRLVPGPGLPPAPTTSPPTTVTPTTVTPTTATTTTPAVAPSTTPAVAPSTTPAVAPTPTPSRAMPRPSGHTPPPASAGAARVVLTRPGRTVGSALARLAGDTVSSTLAPFLGVLTAQQVGQTVANVVASPQYPLGMGSAAVLFLLVQHRIDGRDPKLDEALLSSRDTELVFPDAVRPVGARR